MALRLAVPVVTAAMVAGGAAVPALAVNANHGTQVVSATPESFTPHVMDGAVLAIVQVDTEIVVGGTFTKVSPSATYSDTSDDVTRVGLFAFDATTGVIDPNFNPTLGGGSPYAYALDTDGTNVYVGGPFASVGGSTTYSKLVALTVPLAHGLPGTGVPVTTFMAKPNSSVNDIVVRGPLVYIGGSFTSIFNGTTKKSVARSTLAALSTVNGSVSSLVNVAITGTYNGGTTMITKFDVNLAGTALTAVGNFSSVGGATHYQVATILTPPTTAAVVSGWSTDAYSPTKNSACAKVFNTFVRDIDYSPDGSYFVITATGAFGGGGKAGTMCDTVSRWEGNQTATGQVATWIDYTGGDSTYGVAVTGAAIYVGGHMRWENNPFAGDAAGPGAVTRTGIAALDPVNGLPLSWNPSRSRDVGAKAMYATPQGLWVGSDGPMIANQIHARIALMPLAGGATIPSVAPTTLPNTFFQPQASQCTGGQVLYRVNAGGAALSDPRLGAVWSTDTTFRNTGTVGSYGYTVPVDTTVPACTDPRIFSTELYDRSTLPELHYGFPVTAGRSVIVRMYFADRATSTQLIGQRVFNVRIDGKPVLTNFDIDATAGHVDGLAAGHGLGTMQQFTIASDGVVDIDFSHITDNPMINGIEILDATANPPGPMPGTGVLQQRGVDSGGVPTGPATTANSTVDWSTVRGAFMVNGVLYYGLYNGSLKQRTFDPSTGAAGTETAVNLFDAPSGERIPFAIAACSGMFYDPSLHRLYYTVSGDKNLYYRYFTPESQAVGAMTFTANSAGVDFSTAAGLTLAGGNVFYGSTGDGALRSVGYAGGAVTAGLPTVLSNDNTWRSRAIFAPNS